MMSAGGGLGVVLGSGVRGWEPPPGLTVLERHGAGEYLLPHEIDHVANMRGLLDAGCHRVLAIGSVGGLHPRLEPGTLVCPDEFIALDAPPQTAVSGPRAHRVPGFDPEWRSAVLSGLADGGAEVEDGGVYWQVRGPRLETAAEIRLIAQFADVVGMTVGSECVAAGELGLAYAALCVVDNYANGVAETELTLAEIEVNRAANRDRVLALLADAIPRLA